MPNIDIVLVSEDNEFLIISPDGFLIDVGDIIIIADQRPAIVTPGFADYKVRLKDHDGVVVAEFDTWRALTFTHRVNQRGSIRLEINGEDVRSALFIKDGQLEVWRRNQIVGLDWYLEWEGMIRTQNKLIYANDNDSLVAYGFTYLDLARRAYIMWAAGSDEAAKSGVAETVMKEYVSENIGVLALATGGREADNVMPGLTIEGDAGEGASWEGSRAYKNLLETLEKISLASLQNDDPLDFDIVGTGAATFEFTTYGGQRGLDRTKDNTDGNAPVIFSTGFGNMAVPTLSENATNEITAMYALGAGRDDARQTALSENLPAQGETPWNRIEKVVNATNQLGDQLGVVADENLEKFSEDIEFNFDVLQLLGTYYGEHYSWGDRVTASFKGTDFDKKIVEVTINVSAQADGEEISLVFADS